MSPTQESSDRPVARIATVLDCGLEATPHTERNEGSTDKGLIPSLRLEISKMVINPVGPASKDSLNNNQKNGAAP